MTHTPTIDTLELSPRTLAGLGRTMTIDQFLQLTRGDVMRVENLGQKSWAEVDTHQRNFLRLTALRSGLKILRTEAQAMGMTIGPLTHA